MPGILNIQVWVVHYSVTSDVAVFSNKESALADILRSRGREESITEHPNGEIVLHYARNYNVRLYPKRVRS